MLNMPIKELLDVQPAKHWTGIKIANKVPLASAAHALHWAPNVTQGCSLYGVVHARDVVGRTNTWLFGMDFI